jgi:hypothetical protein
MKFFGWHRSVNRRAVPHSRSKTFHTPRLALEQLEDRMVPSLFAPTLYFTTFAGGADVDKVTVTYDSTARTYNIGPVANVASTPGADGIAFTSDGFLAVGGQQNAVFRVNPSTGGFTSQNAGGTRAFEMMVAPNQAIYSSGTEGGNGTPVSYNSTLTNNGTPHPISGSEAGRGVTHIAWTGSDPLTDSTRPISRMAAMARSVPSI